MDNDEHHDNTCSVCSEQIEIFAVGACDHPICYKCSTRMRVLCEHMYCAICRTNLPQVFLVNECAKFESLKTKGWHSYRKSQTFFQDKDIKNKFFELLDHKCPLCKDRPPDRFLQDLTRHMRRDHEMFFCDLCVEHLKIFTYQRKIYDRKQLATHRREGDLNDTAYKGHPLCKFCDVRYLDNDELSRHLRKDHYYCHFCDTDGSNQYYSEYPVLMEHFRDDHYLCDEGECIDAQFTHAFRTEIDFKAHRANFHNKGMKRSFMKQARTLDVEFSLAPRTRPERGYRDYSDGSGRGGRGSRQGRDRYNNNNRAGPEDPELTRALEASLIHERERDFRERQTRKPRQEPAEKPKVKEEPVQEFKNSSENFPTLSGNSSPVPDSRASPNPRSSPPPSNSSLAHKLALSEGHTVRSGGRGSSMEEFPSLGNAVPTANTRWVRGKGPGVSASSDRIQAPRPQRQAPRPQMQAPRPQIQAPRPQMQAPRPQIQAPRPQIQAPIPQSQAPIPQSQAPRPQTPLKQSDVIKPTAPRPTQWAFTAKINKSRNSEEFPDLPSSSRNNTRNQIVGNGSWGNKAPKSQSKTEQSIKKKPKPKATEPVPVTGGLTLADLGKSLHEESYPPMSVVSSAIQESNNSNAADGKSKSKKKKKQKEKVEISDSEFTGYPEIRKEVKEETKEEKSMQEKDNNKENSSIKVSVTDNSKQQQQRKKEEPWIHVDSGKKQWTMVDSVEDFPTLSTPAHRPPPGFSNSTIYNPPPGFSSNTISSGPPPGFSKPILSSSNALHAQDIMNISNIDTDSIPKVYSKPTSFSERNKSLIDNIRSSLNNDADKFSVFKIWSGEFRQGTTSAKSYYDQCVTLLGKERFPELFAELLVLLPDISKQQELLMVHVSSEKSVKKKAGWNTINTSLFYTCPVCQQVLINTDKPEHLSLHNSDSDFPSLSQPEKRIGSALRSWVKAT